MRVAITGGTGFIGAPLVERLCAAGHSVRVLTRRPEQLKGLPAGATPVFFEALSKVEPAVLEGCEAVVHLAGESISQRWTPATKDRVLKSRTQGTSALARAAAASGGTVKTFVSASAVGYYGPRGDEVLTEESPAGDDFLASVCKAWEAACEPARAHGLRVVNPRIGVVLHPSGGALAKLIAPFKLGAGGRMGTGKQWMSWIHRDDLVSLFAFALETPSLSGPVNATAPHPMTNHDFSVALGRALHRPSVVPTPAWALKLALGEMATVVLDGQRALPRKAEAAGFPFQYPTLTEALGQLLPRRAA